MTYKALYFRLVAAIDDALTLIECGKSNDASALLQNALMQTEECHMENDVIPEKQNRLTAVLFLFIIRL